LKHGVYYQLHCAKCRYSSPQALLRNMQVNNSDNSRSYILINQSSIIISTNHLASQKWVGDIFNRPILKPISLKFM